MSQSKSIRDLINAEVRSLGYLPGNFEMGATRMTFGEEGYDVMCTGFVEGMRASDGVFATWELCVRDSRLSCAGLKNPGLRVDLGSGHHELDESDLKQRTRYL